MDWTLWPAQTIRVFLGRFQPTENQTLRFQNIYSYFWFVPGNHCSRPTKKIHIYIYIYVYIYIYASKNHQASIVKHKGWCEHLGSVLHDLFENLLMTSINGCSKNILSDPWEFSPSISAGIPPAMSASFCVHILIDSYIHWHADLRYIVMDCFAIVEQQSYDIVGIIGI